MCLPNPEWRPAPEKTGVAPTSAPMPFPSQTSKEGGKGVMKLTFKLGGASLSPTNARPTSGQTMSNRFSAGDRIEREVKQGGCALKTNILTASRIGQLHVC